MKVYYSIPYIYWFLVSFFTVLSSCINVPVAMAEHSKNCHESGRAFMLRTEPAGLPLSSPSGRRGSIPDTTSTAQLAPTVPVGRLQNQPEDGV